MLQALIWDVDGTLAETEEAGHREAFNRAFAEAGLPWVWSHDTYRRLLAVTGGKERISAWWHELDPQAAAAGAATVRRLHARKTELYGELLRQGAVPLRPGVERLIREAHRAGVRQAIATTTTPENVTTLLDVTLGPQAHGWFEVIGAGDIVAAKKPAPDIYLWVLQRLNLGAAQCMALEDSAAGARAALAAGLATVVTRSAYTQHESLPQVLADLSDLGEPDRDAQGLVQGRAWAGCVDLAWLKRWQPEWKKAC